MNAQTSTSGAPLTATPFLRKITPKSVSLEVGLDLLKLQRPVPPLHLYDLFGTVRSARVVEDRSGMNRKPSIKFGGKFKAVTQSGKEFDSGVTFIPVLDEMLATALKEAQDANPDAQIEIALSIGIVTAPEGKPSMTGYEFDVQRILQGPPSVHDPIQRMREQAAQLRRLSGPDSSGNGHATGHGVEGGITSTDVGDAPIPDAKHRPRVSR